MKKLFLILLIVVSIQAIGQKHQMKKDSLFFPPKSFNCIEEKDNFANQYWTEYLLGCHKKSLFNDTSSINAYNSYRLIYWGSSVFVFEIIKKNKLSICIVDSLNHNNNKCFRTIDTLKLNSKFTDLQKSIDLLWDKQSYEDCIDNDLYMIDDSDVWVLEFKIGNRYKVIERHKPDIEIKNSINCLLDICNIKNKNIRPQEKN